jgi:hypothetical protein
MFNMQNIKDLRERREDGCKHKNLLLFVVAFSRLGHGFLTLGNSAPMPELPFFRHASGKGGVQKGSPCGPKYLNQWWLRACEKLGIRGVPLYPGTRHSSARALEVCTPEEIKFAMLLRTNTAFMRYIGTEHHGRLRSIYEKADMAGKDEKKVIPLSQDEGKLILLHLQTILKNW